MTTTPINGQSGTDNDSANHRSVKQLLMEKRISIVNDRVSRGVHASKVRSSGVAWIPEVPDHWKVFPLKYVTKCNQRTLGNDFPSNSEIEYVDIGNVTNRGIISAREILIFSDAPSRARRLVIKDDIIISTVRTYLRAVAFIEDPPANMVVSTGFAVISCGPMLMPRYAYYQLQSHAFLEQVVGQSVGVSYPAIAPSKIGRLPFLVPPLAEQTEIAQSLDDSIGIIDEALDLIDTTQATGIAADVRDDDDE